MKEIKSVTTKATTAFKWIYSGIRKKLVSSGFDMAKKGETSPIVNIL